MTAVAFFMFFALPIADAVWFFLRAHRAGMRLPARIGLALLPIGVFYIAFFTINPLIDQHMPRWFYQFINANGDAAGVSLVMLGIGLAVFLSGLAITRRPPQAEKITCPPPVP